MTHWHARCGWVFGSLALLALVAWPLRAVEPEPAKKSVPAAPAPDKDAKPAEKLPTPDAKSAPTSEPAKEAAPAAGPDDDAEEENSKAPNDVNHDRETLELLKVFVDSLDQIERNYVKPIDRRELMEAAIQGMLDKLDPYSSYITPGQVDRFRSSVESQFGGIGIQVSMEQGVLKIITPLVGTPAYRAGLMSGDTIIDIEGKPVAGVPLDEAVRRLKGPVGTKVSLTVLHAGKGGKQTVTLTREIVHVETVMGDRRTDKDQWDFMYDREKRIGYIRVTSFGRDTVRDLRRALEQLQKDKVRGLVLDLRFNPGGLLTSAIETCDLFIDKGRIVSTKGRNVKERVWDAKAEGTFGGFPMAILVNHYSASASEIVSACLQDHQRAMVVGERSWGKGSVQNVIDLEDGKSVLKLTTASYWRPNGKNIHRFPDAKEGDEWGVRPDKEYEVALTTEEMRQLVDDRRERDIVLPHEAVEKPAATSVEPAKEEKGAKPTDEKPAATRPQSKVDAPEKITEKKAEKDTEKKNDAEKKPDDAKQADPTTKAKASVPPPKAPYVDRQLQRALEYLNVEFAKAS
ncbi:MAG: PDZ domain-containing protein [Planctomycetes bacterium]|nr:PDZ domain-containing protein [Planctomycetota bacterium]